MRDLLRRYGPWLAAWAALSVLGCLALARMELSRLRESFETDARIAHRLLSQRAVEHEAVLATLALLQPAGGPTPAEQRLPALYPQILSVQRRDSGEPWPSEKLQAAQAESRASRRPVLADVDFAQARYRLVLAAEPASFALLMDLRAIVPWTEWPMPPATSPVRATLEHAGQAFVLQAGNTDGPGWRFDFRKHLAAESQPFDLVAVRRVGWVELPWPWMLAWTLAMSAAVAAGLALRRQRAARQRAEELLRLGQVARLNTLGELSAGIAHELNQPLTAVLANTQAAGRLLADEPPDLDSARGAMGHAVEQARRAAAVVGRLRRVLERPDPTAPLQAVALQDAVRNAFYLLEPEFARRQVTPRLHAPAAPVSVQAEAVALEQIVHNLLMNALQALDQVPAPQRGLEVTVAQAPGRGLLEIADSGPGVDPLLLPRIFEPFFTTREGGLGLGLSLCESLASGMGGSLAAAARSPRGAVFTLSLPMAPA